MSHATLRDGLVHWWQLDNDPADGIIIDSMGRTKLTVTDCERTNGATGYAIHFGTNGLITGPSTGFTTMQHRSFTIMTWFLIEEVSGPNFPFMTLVSKFGLTTGEFSIRYEMAAFIQALIGDVPTALLAVDIGIPVLNTWHMAVLTYNHQTGRGTFRLDNRNNVTERTPMTAPVESTNPITIGNDYLGQYPIVGSMGPTAIWWRELDRDEVSTLWNNGVWLTFEQTEQKECKAVTCCDKQNFAYQSSEATDASGDIDERGPSNPNCPDGYVWGGLACIREQEPQICSDGYYWNGVACVAEGDSIVCAAGYYLSAGACVQCDVQDAPELVPAAGQITLNFNVADGLSYNIFRSNDGQNYTLIASDVGVAGPETYVDNTTTAGLVYSYYLSVYQNLECGYVDGQIASTLAV